MASLNKVLLMGRLTRDPEKRATPAGTPVADFGLALNRRYRTAEGEEREEVCFVDVTAWGRQGDFAAQYLRKGTPIFVEGRLRMDEWEQDGQKRRRIKVVAENIQFLESAPRDKKIEFADAPPDEDDEPPLGGRRSE